VVKRLDNENAVDSVVEMAHLASWMDIALGRDLSVLVPELKLLVQLLTAQAS
jgi:hypothetical protein